MGPSRRFTYRTVAVPLYEGDPYQRPDVLAVAGTLGAGERIVSVYSVGTGFGHTPRLEALIEAEVEGSCR